MTSLELRLRGTGRDNRYFGEAAPRYPFFGRGRACEQAPSTRRVGCEIYVKIDGAPPVMKRMHFPSPRYCHALRRGVLARTRGQDCSLSLKVAIKRRVKVCVQGNRERNYYRLNCQSEKTRRIIYSDHEGHRNGQRRFYR